MLLFQPYPAISGGIIDIAPLDGYVYAFVTPTIIQLMSGAPTKKQSRR
jgi:hypothetical protein